MQSTPAFLFPRGQRWVALGAVLLASLPAAFSPTAAAQGPKNATVLLIRHAEKPEAGDGLSPAGEERAKNYVAFFQKLMIQSQPAKPQALVATADSKGSRRPRITLEPLARALGIPVEARFKNKDYPEMVQSLRAGGYDGKTILICWHHGDMPDVLRELGADPSAVLPGGKWPSEEYDWLVELRYDAQGRVQSAERVEEHLTAEAAGKDLAPATAH